MRKGKIKIQDILACSFLDDLLEVGEGHRPVIVKRAVIGSKGGWKLSTIFFKL